MKKFLINKNDIISGVAKWGVAQSPYHRPENLEVVLDKLNDILTPLFEEAEKINLGFIEMDYEHMKEFVFEHTTKIPEFVAWNEPKKTGWNGTSSRFHSPKPDYDFIDLHALARNVVNDKVWDTDGGHTPIPLMIGKAPKATIKEAANLSEAMKIVENITIGQKPRKSK